MDSYIWIYKPIYSWKSISKSLSDPKMKKKKHGQYALDSA